MPPEGDLLACGLPVKVDQYMGGLQICKQSIDFSKRVIVRFHEHAAAEVDHGERNPRAFQLEMAGSGDQWGIFEGRAMGFPESRYSPISRF